MNPLPICSRSENSLRPKAAHTESGNLKTSKRRSWELGEVMSNCQTAHVDAETAWRSSNKPLGDRLDTQQPQGSFIHLQRSCLSIPAKPLGDYSPPKKVFLFVVAWVSNPFSGGLIWTLKLRYALISLGPGRSRRVAAHWASLGWKKLDWSNFCFMKWRKSK